jgi:hypothetical protein
VEMNRSPIIRANQAHPVSVLDCEAATIAGLPEAGSVPQLNRPNTRKPTIFNPVSNELSSQTLPDEQIAAAAKVLGALGLSGRWEGEGLYVLRLSRTKLLFIFDTDATPVCRIINSNSRLRISRTRSTPAWPNAARPHR